jgi:coenzyme PQQ precursor peptide PqqA
LLQHRFGAGQQISRPGTGLQSKFPHNSQTGGWDMKKWSKPKFQNMRYGFEINLYVKVR